MGVFSALNIGASGLTSFGEAVRVIGDNIANVNTLGFKSQNVSFGDVLGQTVNVTRSNIANQVGNGVRIGAITRDQSQGSVEGTTNGTDMAINGAGFFVVRDPSTNTTQFTRAGAFFLDKNSDLINGQGFQLQGWALDKNGNTTGNVTGVTVSNIAASASPTTQVDAGINLNSAATTIDPAVTLFDPTVASSYTYKTDVTAYDALGNTHTVSMYFCHVGADASTPSNAVWDWHAVVDGSDVGKTAGTPYEISPTVLNALNSGVATTDLKANAIISPDAQLTAASAGFSLPAGTVIADQNGSTWTFGAATTWPQVAGDSFSTFASSLTTADPTGTLALGPTATGTNLSASGPYHIVSLGGAVTGSGTMAAGNINTGASVGTTGTVMGAQALSFDSSTGALVTEKSPTLTFPWTSAASGAINFNFGTATTSDAQTATGSGTDGTVQLAGASSTRSMIADGFAAGFLDHLETGSDGIINGVFTNGQRRALYQMALAKFPNPAVLSKQGNNMLTETIASGPPVLGKPNNAGLGSIQSFALEKSNVDLASEFTKLIVIQRAYEANSKTILTTDQMLSALMTLKR